MPTIAIVEGVWIVLSFRDHLPPHFHAVFSGHEARVSILTGEVLHGALPRGKLSVVRQWLAANRREVAYIWSEARQGRYRGGMIE